MAFKNVIGFITKRTKSSLNEKGNMLIWYIFMMPVFLAAVGLAVDTSIVSSNRASLQTSLDAATQGTTALSKNQTDGGKPRLTNAQARASVIKLYDANRSGIYADRAKSEGVPFIICQPGGGSVVVAPSSKCNFKITTFSYSTNGQLANGGYLTVTVQEQANTVFLKFLGIDTLTYTITSTSRLTNTFN
jgi:Flp pilus assembly protein TadG